MTLNDTLTLSLGYYRQRIQLEGSYFHSHFFPKNSLFLIVYYVQMPHLKKKIFCKYEYATKTNFLYQLQLNLEVHQKNLSVEVLSELFALSSVGTFYRGLSIIFLLCHYTSLIFHQSKTTSCNQNNNIIAHHLGSNSIITFSGLFSL